MSGTDWKTERQMARIQMGKDAIKPYLRALKLKGIKIPETYRALVSNYITKEQLSMLPERFVAKHETLHSGTGILILDRQSKDLYEEPDGKTWTGDRIATYYRKNYEGAKIVFEERIDSHPDLKKISTYGTMVDLRVFFFRGKFGLTWVRVPTKESRGYGNLARGGFSLFANKDGKIFKFEQSLNKTMKHPEYGDLDGYQLPCWKTVLNNLSRIPAEFNNPAEITVDGTITETGDYAVLELHKNTALGWYVNKEGQDWYIRMRKTGVHECCAH